MKVKTYIPHPSLQEFVLSISTVSVMLPEGRNEVVTPYPPTPFQSLLFYCNHPVSMRELEKNDYERQPFTVLLGPQYSRVNIKVHRELCAIRVDFHPGGIFRILGIPMNELFDKGFDAVDIFGAGLKTINEQLQNVSSLEEGKIIVEKFLLGQVKDLRERLPFDSALSLLMNTDGKMSMEELSRFACLSLKQFERKCKERIGMNPKMYARILKFSRAYRMHEARPNLKWTDIAYEAGYFDQMHMIKDFKVFAGVNPTVIEQELLSTPIRMQKYLNY